MLSHLTAYNFHFQLNIKNMSTVLGWSSSSNPALVVLDSWFEKWEIKLELQNQLEVKPTAVHRNWTEALKSLISISAKNRDIRDDGLSQWKTRKLFWNFKFA